MKRVNLNELDFKHDDDDPKGFETGYARFGKDLGAKSTGSTVYDIPPGNALCPYHWETAEEEWLLVLEGKPTLRDPDGEHELGVMDLVFFPNTAEGAHRIDNKTDEPVRVLMYSDVITPAATIYPDSDKVGIWTGDDETKGMFRRSTEVEYFDGEA